MLPCIMRMYLDPSATVHGADKLSHFVIAQAQFLQRWLYVNEITPSFKRPKYLIGPCVFHTRLI